jgi:energy-coupling factor transporter transmembrane protein EcfT
VTALIWLLLAASSLIAGGAIAWNHPLWPAAMMGLVLLSCIFAARCPGRWLFVVPASLPFLNFSPWTGWLVFEEFDVLVLGLASGAYARNFWLTAARKDLAKAGVRDRSWISLLVTVQLICLGSLGALSMCRGFVDAGGFSFDWFAGYEAPMNSLRIAKSLLLSLLLVPVLKKELQRPDSQASRCLGYGMVTGLALVTLSVLWERMAMPGLLEFSVPYRTTALFWEMHVGGAAIDSYLAMATPFAVWALWRARQPSHWAAAALLMLLAAHSCLTTFSRGVYLAVCVSLALLLWLRWRGPGWRQLGWRRKAGLLLAIALLGEVLLVLGGGSFMLERVARSDKDLGNRIIHWRNGLDLLSGPQDWWLGKGLGRLPSNYARSAPRGEFPGQVSLLKESGPQRTANIAVTVAGPKTLPELGGHYGLTQRVALVPGVGYEVSLDVRVREEVQIDLEVCERHLLYERQCQVAMQQMLAGDAGWQHLHVPLLGPELSAGAWYAPRLGQFSISIANAGGIADFDNVRLTTARGVELLSNGDFSHGLAHWFPVAQYFFLPWHIDNLGLELLIERGILGVLIVVLILLTAFWILLFGVSHSHAMAACLVASLNGVLVVGLVSSVMDVPRVAFMFFLLTFYSMLPLQKPQESSQ